MTRDQIQCESCPEPLSPDPGRTEVCPDRGLRAVINDGIMSHLMGVCTGGVFLVAAALHLGASNFQIGLLAAIPPLSQFIQIPAIFLIEALKSRKKAVLITAFVSRLAWPVAAAIPFLFAPGRGLAVLMGAVAFQAAVGGIGGCAWNSWMRDLIPEKRMGRFFSLRSRIAVFIGLFASLLAGWLVDDWQSRFSGFPMGAYSVLFTAGFIAGMFGVYFLTRIPDVPMVPQRISFFALLRQPFADKNYRKLLVFLAAWNFAVNLAAPFFTVYMLRRLGISMTGVIAMSIVSQVCNFTFLGLWGKWADRFSNKSVLAVSGPLFLGSIFAWTFTSVTEWHFLTWPLLTVIHIFMGISTAGTAIAGGNIGLKLAPKGQGTAYLVALSLVNSLAAGIAPVIGGKGADFLAPYSLSFILQWAGPGGKSLFTPVYLRHWDFLFGLAFLIGFYALHRLTLVEEKGHVDEKLVLNELLAVVKNPLRSLSTGSGLLQLVSYPFVVLLKRRNGPGRRPFIW